MNAPEPFHTDLGDSPEVRRRGRSDAPDDFPNHRVGPNLAPENEQHDECNKRSVDEVPSQLLHP